MAVSQWRLCNYFHPMAENFWGKLPIFGETLNFLLPFGLKEVPSDLSAWRVFQRSVLSVFRRYLSHLTCGKVHFCCIEISITSRSVGSKNYFAIPILVRPNFFAFEIFQVFFDGFWCPVCDILLKCVFRFSLAMYTNKWALGQKPHQVFTRMCVNYR